MGIVLLIIGLVVLGVGVFFFLKMKRMASAPFKKTGEIAQNPAVADAKGMISTEGQIAAQQTVRAPCSGQPCLYYEVTVERMWEKMVTTQRGTSKQTGTTKVNTNKGGAIFQLNDGSGPVNIDAREGVDADLNKTHEEKVPIGMMVPGEIAFGQMRMQTPVNLGAERTTAFRAVEKILPATGNLYACGKLVNGAISKPGWTSLILSHKGREALLGSTKKKAYAGLGIGAVMAAASIPVMILAPKSLGSTSTSCPSAMTDAQPKCDETLTTADGDNYTWTVTKAGLYTIKVIQPAGLANPIDSTLTITDSKGAQVAYNDGGSPGVDAHVTQAFEPGKYTINVRDFAKEVVEGGYSYALQISNDGPSTGAAVAAGTAADTAAPTTTAQVTPGKTAPGLKPGPAAKPAAKPAATVAPKKP